MGTALGLSHAVWLSIVVMPCSGSRSRDETFKVRCFRRVLTSADRMKAWRDGIDSLAEDGDG
jgi:hypothetical protein